MTWWMFRTLMRLRIWRSQIFAYGHHSYICTDQKVNITPNPQSVSCFVYFFQSFVIPSHWNMPEYFICSDNGSLIQTAWPFRYDFFSRCHNLQMLHADKRCNASVNKASPCSAAFSQYFSGKLSRQRNFNKGNGSFSIRKSIDHLLVVISRKEGPFYRKVQ